MLQRLEKKQLIKELMRLKDERKTFLLYFGEGNPSEFSTCIISDFYVTLDNEQKNESKIVIYYEYNEPEYKKSDYRKSSIFDKLIKKQFSETLSFDCIFWDTDLETLVYFNDMTDEEEYRSEIIDNYKRIE